MEDLPLGRTAALVPEFAVKDLPLDRTLMTMMSEATLMTQDVKKCRKIQQQWSGQLLGEVVSGVFPQL